VPGAVAGKLLEAQAETVFRNPLLIAGMLSVFGLVLLAADRWGRRRNELAAIKWLEALLIGVSQALAVIPGVSRSGCTIAAGLGLGLTRETAARFSFLLSLPIIFGAGLAHVRHFGAGGTHAEWVTGFLAAALSGFLSIKYLLRYVATRDYKPFVWYRLGLAVVILIVLALRGG
jgi:undecaprenyl-diphosphatase